MIIHEHAMFFSCAKQYPSTKSIYIASVDFFMQKDLIFRFAVKFANLYNLLVDQSVFWIPIYL